MGHLAGLLQSSAFGLLECSEYNTEIYQPLTTSIFSVQLEGICNRKFTFEKLSRKTGEQLPD